MSLESDGLSDTAEWWDGEEPGLTRRALASAAVLGVSGLAGCMRSGGGSDPSTGSGTGDGNGNTGETGSGSTGSTGSDAAPSLGLDSLPATVSSFNYIKVDEIQENDYIQIYDETNDVWMSGYEGFLGAGIDDVRDTDRILVQEFDGDKAVAIESPAIELNSRYSQTDTVEGFPVYQDQDGFTIAQKDDLAFASQSLEDVTTMLETHNDTQPAATENGHDQQYLRQLVNALNEYGGQGQIINGAKSTADPLGDIKAYGRNINWSEKEMIAAGIFESASSLSENKREVTSGFPGSETEYSEYGNVGVITSEEITGLNRVSNGFLVNPNIDN